QILTPEGAKILVKDKEKQQVEEAQEAPEPEKEEHGAEDAEEEGEARDAVPPGLPSTFRSRAEDVVKLPPKLVEAERSAASIEEEYQRMDEVHMKTLTDWVAEFNALMQEIGRSVIERAQGYYDSRALWQQAVQDFAHQQGQLDDVNATLSVAVKKLATAEAAFESYLQGKDPLNEEQWRALSAAKVDDEAFDGDPKLLRMIRVSCLADSVATLQRQRDVANSELVAKREELDDARRRFEFEDAQHSGCTWNCSVKRAAPFYEKRRLHESKVDQQLQQLQLVEQRLHVARQKVAQLQAESPSGRSRRSRQLDELSLQSFEIAGGEPALDEWHSCNEDEDSADER
ncbi:unnamed protein product, partial [Durusdinium trenchii]